MPRTDEDFMRLAIAEAKKAMGRTSPNPCVGAIVVAAGKVVAAGYHEKAGTPHAEVHALQEAGDKARGATMYVTLEPCSHTGRTPPCCIRVADSGVARVVVGMVDPNPLVAGSGCRYLSEKGIEVEVGVLEEECRRINAPFIKYITTGMPLVSLKAGLSLDARLNYQRGKAGWITGKESLERTHQLRNSYDAILIGRGTAVIDNPSLTTRLAGNTGRDPLRIVLDSQLAMDPTAKMLSQKSEALTWIFHGRHVADARKEPLLKSGAELYEVECDEAGHLALAEILQLLADKGIISVLVEGGGTVFSSFLQNRLADRAHLFYAPLFAGSCGESLTPALDIAGREQAVRLGDVSYTMLGEDMLVEGTIVYPPV